MQFQQKSNNLNSTSRIEKHWIKMSFCNNHFGYEPNRETNNHRLILNPSFAFNPKTWCVNTEIQDYQGKGREKQNTILLFLTTSIRNCLKICMKSIWNSEICKSYQIPVTLKCKVCMFHFQIFHWNHVF